MNAIFRSLRALSRAPDSRVGLSYIDSTTHLFGWRDYAPCDLKRALQVAGDMVSDGAWSHAYVCHEGFAAAIIDESRSREEDPF